MLLCGHQGVLGGSPSVVRVVKVLWVGNRVLLRCAVAM